MKRIVSIQDISCLGKCSLTVALPIISAMGVETCVVPTAVLSTHTGGFSGFTFHDLTQEIQPISDHWQKEGIAFDAIYTGYLGSFEQIQLVSQFFDRFGGGDTLVYADPAMADNGVLYTGFTPEFALEMGKLCGKAAAQGHGFIPRMGNIFFHTAGPPTSKRLSQHKLLYYTTSSLLCKIFLCGAP